MAYTPTDNPYIPGDPYSYDLKWIVAKIKEALSSIEGLTTGQSDLSNDFEELREYVYNYFDNLNISQEVEDKINELYADGFFDDIIEGWMNDHIKWTNPNLLDNSWFSIRQRGEGTFNQVDQTYPIDRWKWIGGTNGQLSTNDSFGITMRLLTGASSFLVQLIDNKSLYGKTLTASINVNGSIYQATGTAPAAASSSEQIFINRNPFTGLTFRASLQSTGLLRFDIVAQSTTTNLNITAVKLELGTYSTLANDAPPNFAEELAKCQRYFTRLKPITASGFAGIAIASDATQARAMLPLPTTIRDYAFASDAPFSGVVLRNYDLSQTINVSAVTFGTVSTGMALLIITASGLTAGQTYFVSIPSGAYIDIPADL